MILTISFVFLFEPAPGPTKIAVILSFFRNFFKSFILLISHFSAEGKRFKKIDNFFLFARIFTDPTPTLKADSALRIVAPK